jgi:hypothetical protein
MPPDRSRALAVPHPDIAWPPGYAPHEAPVFVHNRRHIAAPPDVVWAWLQWAAGWPSWYPNSHRVELVPFGRDVSGGQLALHTRFWWRTFGVGIMSEVTECDPARGWLAWNGEGRMAPVRVYHAWRLIPDGTGTLVVTEETQHGWGARAMHRLRPRRMWEGHELWLACLERKAVGGPPPP